MTRLAIIVCCLFVGVFDNVSAAEPVRNLPLPVALEEMPSSTRDTLAKVMKSPTINALGPTEEFVAHTDMYQWLLDHPDRTAAAWRKLGIDAVDIKVAKDGRFTWKDENGSELTWRNVGQSNTGRIWYAEGKVKPGFLIPTVPVKAVAVLTHVQKPRATGDSIIRHQIQVYLHTDSKAANAITKMLGDSIPKLAEQGSEQLLMFFSGIAKYVHDKPEKAKSLLSESDK